MKSDKIKLFVYEHKEEDIDKTINYNKIYWNGNLKENHSLLKYVEANRYLIRSKYLDFINDLGAKNINDKSLAKISKLKNGHSMWEMSTINEKNIFKSSNIKECLKLLGLISYTILWFAAIITAVTGIQYILKINLFFQNKKNMEFK